MRTIIVLLALLILSKQEPFAQRILLTLDQAIDLSQNSNSYELLRADSLINIYNDRLFKIKVLPKINLNATLPNLNNSISPITLTDGSEKYVDRFYSSANFGISVSQLIPFTGGTLSLSSALDRLDNFNPERSLSYNLNLVNFSYSQKITGYNAYKWEKKLHKIQNTIDNIQLIQRREHIKEEVVNLFFSLYIEQRRLELNRFVQELAEYVYERAVKLFDIQRISEEDLLETEIQYHKAQNNNNDMALSMARQKLADYLNLNNGEELWVEFSPACLDEYKFNFDPENLINLAIKYSSDLTREYDILKNEQHLKDINSDSKPTISLSVGGGINSQADNFSTLMDSKSRRLNVVMSLSVPLFNWGANRIKKNIALQEIQKSDIQYESTNKDDLTSFSYDIKRIYLLLSEIKEDKALLDLLEKRLNLIKTNVQYGKIDMSKIIQAEKQLIQSHMNYVYNIKNVFSLVYKYRALALTDIRDNSKVVEFETQ